MLSIIVIISNSKKEDDAMIYISMDMGSSNINNPNHFIYVKCNKSNRWYRYKVRFTYAWNQIGDGTGIKFDSHTLESVEDG